ncbi:MAG TPA: alpha/beta hydrolase [Cytophagales bacterium]|nr:alpha/beta hydrolase [Cytophagales bacterium]
MRNKNKIKLIFLSGIKAAFRVTEKVSPFLAKRWAVKLFFSPVKFDYPAKEQKLLSQAKTFKVESNGVNLVGYEWGAGPVILFMHGWAGRATQVVEFVEPLTTAGFKVVAIDAPAHGKSPGKKTNILEFKEGVIAATTKAGPVHAAIGHSLGGTSLLFARKESLPVEKLVLISVPSIAEGIIKEFLKKIGGSHKIGESLKNYVYKKFNRSFEEFSALSLVAPPFPPTNFFIIHDRDDMEAPIVHFEKLSEKLPYAKKLITRSFGHTKILRSTEAINSVIEFLKEEKTDLVDNNITTVKEKALK